MCRSAENGINSVNIENTEPISSAKDIGTYKVNTSTTGSIGHGQLSYNWSIISGSSYASILGSNNSNTISIQATNKTKNDQSAKLECTVYSNVSGVESERKNSKNITIPAATTKGYIDGGNVGSTNYVLPDTLSYGDTAYITVKELESTAYNHGRDDEAVIREWSVTNDNAISFSDTTLENVTIENINNTGDNIICEIKCKITFESGLEHVASREITANKR